jgi:hypothetical protein
MHTSLRTLLLGATALFTLACDNTGDELDLAVAADESADESAPTAAVPTLTSGQHSSSGLAGQIAAHPAFAALSHRAWLRVGDTVEARAQYTAEELEVIYSRLEHCRGVSSTRCTEELYVAGVDPVITPVEIGLGQQLRTAFGLDAMTRTQRAALLRDAQAAFVAGGGQGPSPALIPGSFDGGEVVCDLACKQTLLTELTDSHAGIMARIASADAGDWTAAHIWWIEVVIRPWGWWCWWFPCWLPEPEECNDNGDCATDEYCWKGPLGFGENECRDKKSIGDSCGNDDACKSNCCKFNLWDGGATCRAASECN